MSQRLNFDYTDAGVKQLDDLKEKLGVGSRAEVMRYAQGLLNWAVQQAEDGNQVIAVNSGTGVMKELTVPPLDEIRRRVICECDPNRNALSKARPRFIRRDRAGRFHDVGGTIASNEKPDRRRKSVA